MSVSMNVVANSARKTPRGRWLLRGTAAFFLVWMLAANEALRDTPIAARPPGLLIVAIAVAPVVLVFVGLLRDDVARRFGLIEALRAKATMDTAGLTLTFDGTTLPKIPWNSIAALEPSRRDWRLIDEDGAELATIPEELMVPRQSWTDSPTFAELVVQLRPDRYALRGKGFEPGMTEFSIRQPDDVVGRPRSGLQKRVLAFGIVLAIIAFALLISIMPTR
jgi:hypothetical protein